MKRILVSTILFISASALMAQVFSNAAFPVYEKAGKTVIAGSVPAFVYANYTGEDVKKENYTDVHARPEYAVYEFFKALKSGNMNAVAGLYGPYYHKKNFDGKATSRLKNYTGVQFLGKFRSGDLTIIRYNFTGNGKPYPYFAVLKDTAGRWFLTPEINISDPFNVVGSYSPANLPEKPAEKVSTAGMTAFYFVRKGDKVFYADRQPPEDYTTVYLALDFSVRKGRSRENDFLKKFQAAAASHDTALIISMLAKEDAALLKDPYYHSYIFAELKRIFLSYTITPLATLSAQNTKVLWISYAAENEGNGISSMILKDSPEGYSLALRYPEDVLHNILQDVYIREAIIAFLKEKG